MKSLQVLQTLGAGRADSSARLAPGAAVEQSLKLGKGGRSPDAQAAESVEP